jgi:hypothetical protein
MKATGIEKETEDVQVACLLNLIGDEGRKIYSTFQWAVGEDKDKLKDVLKKFNGYCIPLINVAFERFKFFTRMQKDGESVDEFLTHLRILMKTWEFTSTVNLEDSLLRDKLVIECNDAELRERLLRENKSFECSTCYGNE